MRAAAKTIGVVGWIAAGAALAWALRRPAAVEAVESATSVEQTEDPEKTGMPQRDVGFFTRHYRIGMSILVILMLATLAASFRFFMAQSSRGVPPPAGVIVFALLGAVLVALPIIFRNNSLWVLAVTVFSVFIAMILLFSVLYWLCGSRDNFNIELSHLDAIYFALGTLSTAGTGNIVATSETARLIQSIQITLDAGYTLLVVGILVSRISFSLSD